MTLSVSVFDLGTSPHLGSLREQLLGWNQENAELLGKFIQSQTSWLQALGALGQIAGGCH